MLHFPLFCPSAEPSVANISPKLHKSFLQTWCLVCSFSPGSNCFFFSPLPHKLRDVVSPSLITANYFRNPF